MIAEPITDFDVHLFTEGTHRHLYRKLGAHVVREGHGQIATRFTVWAPRARQVSVVGDFNKWDVRATPLHRVGASGLWEGRVSGVGPGARYKFCIKPAADAAPRLKADPFAYQSELRPGNASIVCDIEGHEWGDGAWMAHRTEVNRLDRPQTIYEVHLGSWMRVPEQGNRWLTYREVAPLLADYAAEMGFTHVEFMPLAEHPHDASWGYQPTGFFAPTSRFGSPRDFMALIDTLHQRGVGVVLDWVPSQFPADPHGLVEFDGSPLYEDPDPKRGLNPDRGTLTFDYDKPEVVSFLLSSASYWLDHYHIDGLRVDSVTPMVLRDFGRKKGGWSPNELGGREHLEAIDFLQRFTDAVHDEYPGALTIAEETSAFPGVTRPTAKGGLGFDLKWDVGWMHDTLHGYMSVEPSRRPKAHGKLTFRMIYAFEENHVLVLPHDEVGPGRPSLLGRMPGDGWQKFANLRVMLGYMFAQPGKKHLFMGGEFGQGQSWDPDGSLDWHVLVEPKHAGLKRWVRDLNTFYRGQPSMHVRDTSSEGFSWVDCGDVDQSVFCILRRGEDAGDVTILIANFQPVPRHNYRVGVPRKGRWEEVLNSDAALYGGSGHGNMGGVMSAPLPAHGMRQSVNLVLPPLGLIALRHAE